MAKKSFFVKGEFSGRSTPISGGPKVSKDRSWMDTSIYQQNQGEDVEVCRVESRQNKRDLTTTVTIYPQDGSAPIVHEVHSRY